MAIVLAPWAAVSQPFLPLLPDADTTLPEVFITSRMSAQALNQPYTAQIISKKELRQKMPRTTPELLMGEPGVFVQKTNHGGGSPFIRGLTGNQTLLLIDGIRLNNSIYRYGPNQYFNTIDYHTIQKIEVLKGTGSVQYGSDAIGGIIHVLTRKPEFRTENFLASTIHARMISKNMEYSGRAEIETGNQKVAFLGGYGYKQFGDLVGGDTTGRQTPSGYAEQDFDAQLRFSLSKGWQLRALHQSVIQDDVPVYHKIKLEDYAYHEMDPQTRHLSYVNLSGNINRRYLRQLSVTAAAQNARETRKMRRKHADEYTREKENINTYSVTLNLRHNFCKGWTSQSGVEFYQDHLRSRRSIIPDQGIPLHERALYPDRSGYQQAAVFSLHEFRYQQWQAHTGLRYNWSRSMIPNNELGKVNITSSALVSNFALLYSLSANTRFYGHFSTGFRAPNIDDLGSLGIVDFRYELPAYDLKPEKSYHYEAGIRHNSPRLKAHAAAYYLNLKNLVARVQQPGMEMNGYPVFLKQNAGAGFIRGFELSAEFQASPAFSFRGNLAIQKGWNISDKEPLRRMPPTFGQLAGKFEKGQSYFKAELLAAAMQDRLAAGDKSDNRIPAGGTPGWKVANAYAGYCLHNVELDISLQNIFNVDYRLHGSGINGMGRNMVMHLRITLYARDNVQIANHF